MQSGYLVKDNILVTQQYLPSCNPPSTKILLLRKQDQFNPTILQAWQNDDILIGVVSLQPQIQPFLKHVHVKDRIRVGYSMNEKKKGIFVNNGVLQDDERFQFLPVGIGGGRTDLPVDVLIHKRLECTTPHLIDELLKLDCKIIGSVKHSSLLKSRRAMTSMLSTIQSQHLKLPLTISSQKQLDPLHKVIVKTQIACGHPTSHIMRILNKEQFKDCPFDQHHIVSQYIEHDLLVKVYIMGRHVNFIPDNLSKSQREVVCEGMARLEQKWGLALFGVDVMVDDKGGMWMADLNYFPTYKNVEGVACKFRQLLVQKLPTL